MTQPCLPGCFPNGLSPCFVDPVTHTVVDYTFDNWRTYQTAPNSMFEEDSEQDVIGYIFTESFSMSKLDALFNLEDKFHHRYFGYFTEMMFKTRRPLDLSRIRKIMNDLEDYQEVYTWIPTQDVFIGRRICFASLHNYTPHCKIIGVTDDDGRIRKVMVFMFLTANSLLKDLNKELAFYSLRKGLYKVNYDIEIDGIVFP